MRPDLTIPKSILSGIFISLAGIASAIAVTGNADAGIAKIISGLIFSAGLICTFMASALLFTGTVATRYIDVLNHQLKLTHYLGILFIVYAGNFIGAFLMLPFVYSLSPSVLETLNGIGTAKMTALPFMWFLKGIMCNMLVALATILATRYAKNVIDLIVAISVPVSLFVICGFEHSIANMFLIPAAYIAGANISLTNFLYCMIQVTCGNIVGGVIIATYFKFMGYR